MQPSAISLTVHETFEQCSVMRLSGTLFLLLEGTIHATFEQCSGMRISGRRVLLLEGYNTLKTGWGEDYDVILMQSHILAVFMPEG